MTRTNPLLASIFLMAGLTTACGPNTATAEGGAENAAETQVLGVNTAAADTAETAKPATPAVVETVAAATATPASTPENATATVKALPLRRGFYVASDTPCNQASNATLLLVTREGINGSRDVCTFRKIEKTGATSYRVTESCSGEPTTYEVPNETSFTVKYEGGSESSARYCAQSSLPDPWRDNDISDITG